MSLSIQNEITEPLFETIPNEILEHILSFTGEYSGIVSRVCTLWYSFLKTTSEYSLVQTTCFKSVNMMTWGEKNLSNFSKQIDSIFLNCNSLDVMKYIGKKFYKDRRWTEDSLPFHIDCQFLTMTMLKSKNDPNGPLGEILCMKVAENGNLEILKWLRTPSSFINSSNGLPGGICPWNELTAIHAAQNDQFEILKSICSSDFPGGPCPWSSKLYSTLAKKGNLEILKWLHSMDISKGRDCRDEWTCANAAVGGHLEVLKWLRFGDPRCPWNSSACAAAAEGGHLEVLKWMRDPNLTGGPCPWNAKVCTSAARAGHLELLKWLRTPDHHNASGGDSCDLSKNFSSEKCPWDEYTCNLAVMGGHLEVLKWAYENGCPFNTRVSRIANGEMLEWLKIKGLIGP